MKHKPHRSESGQVLVILVLVMVVLLAAVALAIDGGRLYALRREAQSAADAAVLSAALAKCNGADPITAGLATAGQNGFDSGAVSVLNPPIGGAYIGNADYVEVMITASIPGTFVQLVYSGPLQVSVEAEAHCDDAGLFGNVDQAAFAIGSCPEIKAFDISGSGSEIIGGVHSNDDLYISGSNHHVHGATSHVEGYVTSGSNNQFPPGYPVAGDILPNPLGFLTTSMYAPGGSRVAGRTVHDLSSGGKVDIGRLTIEGLYDPVAKTLATGVYYAGNNEIEISGSDITGAVTLVSENHIKVGGSENTFTAYVDGLLIFSNKQPAQPCKNWVVDIGGGGNPVPVVSHDVDGFSNPVVVTDTNNIYQGLVYAPRGQVMTSGSKTTFRGAILAQGVKLNGSNELFVYTNLYSPSIELTR